MIDNISIFTDQFSLEDCHKILEKNPSAEYSGNNQEIKKYKLKLKNYLSCHFGLNHFYLTGSLPKYYLGNNFEIMRRKDIEKALKKLSEELNIDLSGYRVTRLDIAHTFKMKSPVSDYLNHLERLSNHKKGSWEDKRANLETRYFKSTLKTIRFYDKARELRKATPEAKEIINKLHFDFSMNLLRYEIQIDKPSRVFNEVVTVKKLYEETFYIKMIDYWFEVYSQIEKNSEILDFNFDISLNPKEIINSLTALGLEQLGKDKVFDLIDQKYSRNEISYQNCLRLKKSLKNKVSKFYKKSSLIAELDEKIRKITEGYR